MEWIVGGGALTAFIAMLGVMVRMNQNLDKRIGHVYNKFDEERSDVENKYVQQRVCNVISEQIRKDISEIKVDLKLLLRKNGISDHA